MTATTIHDGDQGDVVRRIILVPWPKDVPIAEPSPEITAPAEPEPVPA